MSLGHLKETIVLHVVCCFETEYPIQRVLAALKQQMKVFYLDQNLIELISSFPLKVLSLTNQHFLI